jgi:phosphatidylinositol alpha-1,6-mannosyltransferase
VYSTVPGTGEGDLVRTLPAPPDRKLGERFGDRLAATRRLNTLTHFTALRRYARRTLAPILARLDDSSRICIGVWSPLAHFWCEALAAAGRPYALFAHGLDVIQPLYPRIAPWRRADFRGAARVIACSSGTAEMAAGRLGLRHERLRVVHPGIDVGSFVPPARQAVESLRAKLGLGGKPVVLSVGRLVGRKGFDIALRAVAAHRAAGGEAVHVIAGDGPERAALEALAKELGMMEHVRFTGAVDDETKLALYELCDVFVMPNTLLNNLDWEGFGIVFLEAARAGKPALGGANGGVPDAVSDGETGLLVDSSDQRAVSDALTKLLTDAALRRRLGDAARARAAARFEWRAVGDGFRSVLEEAW